MYGTAGAHVSNTKAVSSSPNELLKQSKDRERDNNNTLSTHTNKTVIMILTKSVVLCTWFAWHGLGSIIQISFPLFDRVNCPFLTISIDAFAALLTTISTTPSSLVSSATVFLMAFLFCFVSSSFLFFFFIQKESSSDFQMSSVMLLFESVARYQIQLNLHETEMEDRQEQNGSE